MATPVLLASLIAAAFPNLNGRAVAVSEVNMASVSKDTLPRLPVCWVAHLSEVTDATEKNVHEFALTEEIMAMFWLEPTKYRNEQGAETPFYAFYDYTVYRNQMLAIIRQFNESQDQSIMFYHQMDVDVSEYAVMICFRLKNQLRMSDCGEQDETNRVALGSFSAKHELLGWKACCECEPQTVTKKCP